MQSEHVAVETASQRKCINCDSILNSSLAPHICVACSEPQPVLSYEDYFSVLCVKQQFKLDSNVLERRFYELSRVLHPDRFSTSSTEVKKKSLERMSFLNEAYRTLRDKELLRNYILKLENINIPKREPPSQYAEQWFEMQEMLMNNIIEAKKKLLQLEYQLEKAKLNEDLKLTNLENAYDANPSQAVLEELGQEIQTQNYLQSISREIKKLKLSFTSGDL